MARARRRGPVRGKPKSTSGTSTKEPPDRPYRRDIHVEVRPDVKFEERPRGYLADRNRQIRATTRRGGAALQRRTDAQTAERVASARRRLAATGGRSPRRKKAR